VRTGIEYSLLYILYGSTGLDIYLFTATHFPGSLLPVHVINTFLFIDSFLKK
jgi:hypothetical protein